MPIRAPSHILAVAVKLEDLMTDEKRKKKTTKSQEDRVSEEDLENVSGGTGGATHKDSWRGEATSTSGRVSRLFRYAKG